MSGGNPATIEAAAVASCISTRPTATLGEGILGYLQRRAQGGARRACGRRSDDASRPSSARSWRWSRARSPPPRIPRRRSKLLDQARLLEPGHAGRGGRAAPLDRARRHARRRRALPALFEPVCAPLPALALCQPVRRRLRRRRRRPARDDRPCCDRRHRRRHGAGTAEGHLSAARPARGDRRAFPSCPNMPRPKRSGRDRRRRLGQPIRAPCSIRAWPRSPRTQSTRRSSRLKAIDRSRLSESDRQLLAAAQAIAAEVTAAPAMPPAPAEPASPDDRAGDPAAEIAAASADDLPEAEPLTSPMRRPPLPPTPPPIAAAPPPAEAPRTIAPVTYVPTAGQGEALPPDTADQTAEVVADARKKLEEIDKLMKDAEQ